MSLVNTETGELADRVLDALDAAPVGMIAAEEDFTGRLATIQGLSAVVGCSDSATRTAVLGLLDRGLVRVWDALDPSISRRRLYVTGGV